MAHDFDTRATEISKLFEQNKEDIVPGAGVDEKWVDDAETVLGEKLPKSYRWFLQTYGGGYLFSEPLLGLVPEDSEDIGIADDIRSQFYLAKKNGDWRKGQIIIAEMEDGNSTFYFSVAADIADNEYPVLKKDFFEGKDEIFALNFFDFIKEIISERIARRKR